MVRAFLLLGSNEGDRLQYLEKARLEIGKIGKPFVASSVYETAAWGNAEQPAFLNQVVGIETKLMPNLLLEAVLKIEASLGRKRTAKWSSRTMDIDILFYADHIINIEDLVVPHPAIAQRRFTLVPLAEVAPDFMHPVLKKSVNKLLEECEDTLKVTLLDPDQ